MPNYKLSTEDRNEFEEWWNETHHDRDDVHVAARAKEAFEYGIQHGKALVTLDPREQDSYEETIRGLTDLAIKRLDKIATLEVEINRLTSVHPDLPAKLENEVTTLRDQKEMLVLAVSALSDVLSQEVL